MNSRSGRTADLRHPVSRATLYRVPIGQLVFGPNIISGFGFAALGGAALAAINMLI